MVGIVNENSIFSASTDEMHTSRINVAMNARRLGRLALSWRFSATILMFNIRSKLNSK